MELKWFHFKIIAIILFLVNVHKSTSSKLSARRILLPFNNEIATNYTLEVTDSGGCYHWTSSRPDVAKVTPVFLSQNNAVDCSNKAIVTVAYTLPKRQTTFILATEASTGTVFRTDVIVDIIKNIDIITTTKEISFDDVPEVFEVHARNDENDTFTSLDGIEFEWTFEPISITDEKTKENNNGHLTSNLRFVKFFDSPYDVPPAIEYWESRDSHGSKVLIQGIKTGTSFVRAKIVDPFYSNVASSEITLVVNANLILQPSHDIYLIPHASVAYSVNMLKGGQNQPVTMPSDQYYLEVSETDVVSLDVTTSLVTGLKEGMSSIILKDRNIRLGGGVRQPTAEINVRLPSYILLKVKPGGIWALQEFTSYTVFVEIFDDYHHRIYNSDNLEIQVNFPSRYFQVISSSKNGTYHEIKTISPGTTNIIVKLIGARKSDGSIIKLRSPLENNQEVKIYQTLKILPPLILLPWDSLIKPSYTIFPRATGATGFYNWESEDSDMVSVSYTEGKDSSKAKVITNGVGTTILRVTDAHTNVFTSKSLVSVQPIVDINFIPNILETELGSSVFLPLALYGYEDHLNNNKKRVFDDCSKIPLKINIIERTRFVFNDNEESKKPTTPSSCRNLQFDCISIGHSRVWVSYENLEQNINLTTTIIISCHLPLKLIHPQPNGLLAIGTSMELTFEGGPRAWPLSKENHYARLFAANENLFQTSPIIDPYRYKKDLHVFRVFCKEFGSSELELTIGNLQSATLVNPSIQSLAVNVTCGKPVKLFLKPKLKADENCPLNSDTNEINIHHSIPISNIRETDIEVNARDVNGNAFLNISSLSLLWSINDETLAKLNTQKDFVEDFNGAGGFRRWTRNYQRLLPSGKTGDITVDVKATGYKSDSLTRAGVHHLPNLSNNLKASIKLNLVEKPKISPEEMAILNNPNNKFQLKILKGSGHFQVDASSNDVANITYSEINKLIDLIPQKDGLLTIKVTDSCVKHDGIDSFDAIATMKIVNALEIRLLMTDKVEIGKEIDIKVQIIDTRGEYIPSEYHNRLLNLHSVTMSDVVTIKQKPTPKSVNSYSIFSLKGEKLGRTSILFKTGKINEMSNVVSSREIIVQVFSPLRLTPSNISLIVGSVFQVSVVGGPQPQGTIIYSVDDESTVYVSSSGVIEAKSLGSVKLTAKAIGGNANQIYSQDSIKIDIVLLKDVKLNVPSKQLLVGEEMPLYITGVTEHQNKLENLAPFSFGSANPHLRITWSVSDSVIVNLKSLYGDVGIYDPISSKNSANNFRVTLKGLHSGIVTVKVIVEKIENEATPSKKQIFDQRKLVTEQQFQIFENLELISSAGSALLTKSNGKILMSPRSEFQLKTMRQGFSKVSFTLKSPSNKIFIEKGSILKAEDIDENILEVRSQENFGVTQISVYHVIVKPISYIMIKPITKIPSLPSKTLSSIPIGLTMDYGISFHDLTGNKFDSVQSNLKIQPSRFDLISVVNNKEHFNNTLSIRSNNEGITVLKIWDTFKSGNKLIEDFIYIKTGSAVNPISSQSLIVGDIICFESPLLTSEKQSGKWYVSENNNVLIINEQSGIAIARKSGQMTVKYDLSTYSTVGPVISVSLPEFISFIESPHYYLTNSHVLFDKPLVIPFLVNGKRFNNQIKNYCADKNITQFKEIYQSLFLCQFTFTSYIKSQSLEEFNVDVHVSQIFNCEIVYNNGKQNYEAIISIKENSLSTKQLAALSTYETNFTVQVNALLTSSDISFNDKDLTASITVPFYPAFNVINGDEIVVTNVKPLYFIEISATKLVLMSLQIVIGEELKSMIDVFPIEINENSIAKIPIQMRIVDTLWLKKKNFDGELLVRLWSTLTGQSKNLQIKIGWNIGESNCIQLPRYGTSDSNILWKIFTSFINFLIEYYQILLTSISTCLVMFVGFQWFIARKSSNQQLRPISVNDLSFSTSPLSPSKQASTPNLRRVINYQSPSTATSGDLNDSFNQTSNIQTPRSLSKQLWSVRS